MENAALVVIKKRRLTAIATMRDVIWNPRRNDAHMHIEP